MRPTILRDAVYSADSKGAAAPAALAESKWRISCYGPLGTMAFLIAATLMLLGSSVSWSLTRAEALQFTGGKGARIIYNSEAGDKRVYLVDFSDATPKPKPLSPIGGIDGPPRISDDGLYAAYQVDGQVYMSTVLENAPMSDLRYIGPGSDPHFWTHPVTKALYLLLGRVDGIYCQLIGAYHRPEGKATRLVSNSKAYSGRSIDGKFIVGDKGAPVVWEIDPPTAVENAKVLKSYNLASDGYCNASLSPTTDTQSKYYRCVMHNDLTHNSGVIRKFMTNEVVEKVTQTGVDNQFYRPEWSTNVDYCVSCFRYDNQPAFLYNIPQKKWINIGASMVGYTHAWVGAIDSTKAVAVLSIPQIRGPAPFTVDCDAGLSMGTNLQYSWDFGKGFQTGSSHAQHTFSEPGTYSVMLKVRNSTSVDSFFVPIEVVSAVNYPVLVSKGKRATLSGLSRFYQCSLGNLVYLTDGDHGTYFGCGSSVPPFHITIDLGQSQSIRMVVLNWASVNYPTSYKVMAGPDTSHMTLTDSIANGNGGADTLKTSVTGRFVRVTLLAMVTKASLRFNEFSVYTYSNGTSLIASDIALQPKTAQTAPIRGEIKFAATVYDQFGATMPTAKVTWKVTGTGGGTIDSTGLYKAGTTAGKRDTVIATSGNGEARVPILISGLPIVLSDTYANKRFNIGDTLHIRWTAEKSLIDDVYFLLSFNAGKSWYSIPMANSINQTNPLWGDYAYVLPDEIEGISVLSDSCKLKIQEYTKDYATISDGLFSIRPKGSAVNRPLFQSVHNGLAHESVDLYSLIGKRINRANGMRHLSGAVSTSVIIATKRKGDNRGPTRAVLSIQ